MTQTDDEVQRILAEKARRELKGTIELLRHRTGENVRLAVEYMNGARGWLKRAIKETDGE